MFAAGSGPELPLARFSRFALRSAADVNAQYSRLIREHRLRLAHAGRSLVAELRHAPLRRVALSTSRIASDMTVDAAPAVDDYLVFLFRGCPGGSMRFARRRHALARGAAAIVAPGNAFQLSVPAGSETVILTVSRELVDLVLRAATGHLPDGVPVFADDGFLPPGRTAALANLLAFLEADIAGANPALAAPAHLARLEEFLATAILCGTEHDRSVLLRRSDADPRPRHVRLAQAWIEAHADADLSLGALARRVAVSPRTLMRGFRRHAGCSPAQYVRAVRLERARAELLDGPSDRLSVAAVAARWGFGHPGRFARAYRARYEEYPARTLQRRRGGATGAATAPAAGSEVGSSLEGRY